MKAHQAVVLISAALLVLSGCATTVHDSVHGSLNSDAAAMTPPDKVALLPVKVAIHEIGVGGSTEVVPQWSKKGCRLVDQYVKEQMVSLSGIQLVTPPELPGEDKKLLEQHRALYEQVATNRLQIQRIPAWQFKVDHPDDSIGPGLTRLKSTIGADAVLFVSGYDYCASGGRVAAFLLAAAFGAVVPMGHSIVHVGLVDLETGNVLWTDTVRSDTYSLKNETDVAQIVGKVFSKFPKPADPGSNHASAQ